jgi:outer membrane protein assembly factor BamB
MKLSSPGAASLGKTVRMKLSCFNKSALPMLVMRSEWNWLRVVGALAIFCMPICMPPSLLPAAIAQEMNSVIALPDTPFVVPLPVLPRNTNVVTQHNDNFRTGAYLAETRLTPTEVRARGLRAKFVVQVEGEVITQPLYVRDVEFSSGRANGVFVVTVNNKVYALDPDHSGAPKWPPVHLQDSYPSQRPVAQGWHTPTPVIDASSDRLYVLFKTGNRDPAPDDFRTDADAAFWLVALRLHDGAEVGRVKVEASVLASDGTSVNFVAKNQTSHPALLLDRGSLYLGFGARAESEDPKVDPLRQYLAAYHGWILQYRASDLTLQAAFCTSPNRPTRPNSFNPGLVFDYRAAGVWQGGGGLAADPEGNVYFLTGNGRLETDNGLYGDSFLKLKVFPGSLVPSAYTLPIQEPVADLGSADELEDRDADLGSGGALVLPGLNFVVGGGKTGYMYLLDRTSMQLRQRLTAAENSYDPTQDPKKRWETWDGGPHLHGSPTFWPGRGLLYVWAEKDYLKVYAFDTATKKFGDQPAVNEKKTGGIRGQPHTMPGGMMSLSANGKQPGSGIIWAILSIDDVIPGGPPSRARLFAFDAETLELLWDSQFGTTPHWGVPTIADGKVFVTTPNAEVQRGLIGPAVIGYELSPEGDLNWRPYQPKLAYASCQACHTDQQREELTRQNPLNKFFENEAAVWIEPERAKRAVSPPPGSQKSYVFEGNGVQLYTARASERETDKLIWAFKETTADLVEVGPEGNPKQDGVRVQLSAGLIWTASDGSGIVGQIDKTTPSPASINAPWVLYRVVGGEGRGIMTDQTYVQCVYTHAGGTPAAPPKKLGETASVPYYAQYWFWTSSGKKQGSSEKR